MGRTSDFSGVHDAVGACTLIVPTNKHTQQGVFIATQLN